MSYNFDTSGTWLDTLDSKNIGKPVLTSEIQTDDGESLSTSLYVPTPYQEDNIIVLKDGEVYNLPSKTSDGKYIFNEKGYYNISLTTDLGTTSNIAFEVKTAINEPTIRYENNLVSIIDNGSSTGDCADRIEYRINGGQWVTYTGEFRIPDKFINGVDLITIEARSVVGNDVSTVANIDLSISMAEIIANNIEVVQGDIFNELDYATATDIDGTDISDDIKVVRTDVKIDTPGEYKVLYGVEGSNGYFTEKEITVKVNPISINKPSIKYENNLVSIIDNGSNSNNNTTTIEYRINGGEWKTYSGDFRIPNEFVDGVDVTKVEVRTVVGQYISDVSEVSLTISKAEITTTDIEITEGDKFNELDYATAIDIDGIDISGRVTVASSNVQLDTPGEYKVVYKVESNNGYFTEKEIKVTVVKKKLPPVLVASDVSLNKGDKFNPLDFIEATDSDGNSIDKSKIEIIENTVNVLEPGEYMITYKLTDNNGLSSEKTIKVEVVESLPDIDDSTQDDSKNESDNINNTNGSDKDKIPNTGGLKYLIYLLSAISLAGGSLILIKKRKNA